jgi:ABC-type uncharacterized transport system ATPase subunit
MYQVWQYYYIINCIMRIAIQFLCPQVLLMDEITVDMDVLGRMDLLDFFRQECEQRGATIVYATHIFDGLEGWITHVAYLEDGGLVHGEAQILSASSFARWLGGLVGGATMRAAC